MLEFQEYSLLLSTVNDSKTTLALTIWVEFLYHHTGLVVKMCSSCQKCTFSSLRITVFFKVNNDSVEKLSIEITETFL
jgi:hypothetical protein